MLAAATLLALIFTTLMLALAFRAIDPGISRHQLYNPERDALVEAQWQLAHAWPDGASTLDARIRSHIQRALLSLDQAQQDRPQRRQRIEHLRDLLEQLWHAEYQAQQQANARHALYQQIIKRLNALTGPTGAQPGNNDAPAMAT